MMSSFVKMETNVVTDPKVTQSQCFFSPTNSPNINNITKNGKIIEVLKENSLERLEPGRVNLSDHQ